MMTDQRTDHINLGEKNDLVPSMRKTGAFQKTKEAFSMVNSMPKQNANTDTSGMVEMMPFESDSSFDFTTEEDVINIVFPCKAIVVEKLENTKNDDCEDTRLGNQVRPFQGEVPRKGVMHNESEIAQRREASPRSSSPKKSTRSVVRSVRARHSATSQPHLAKSSGSVQQHRKLKSFSAASSNKPSSTSLGRRASMPVPSTLPKKGCTSPDINQMHLVVPTFAEIESAALIDLPETPAFTPTEFHTTKQGVEGDEISWTRISRAFEDDDRAMGGYFAKLLEKMEGDGSQDAPDKECNRDASDKEEQKNVTKSNTATRIRKLFALGRSPRGAHFSEKTGVADEEDVSEMAVFTAFISSPIPIVDKKRLTQPTDDVSDSKSHDFLQLQSERRTGLEHPNGIAERMELPSTPKSIHSIGSFGRFSAGHSWRSSTDAHRGKSDVIIDPGSPSKLKSKHRRSGKCVSPDSPSNGADGSTPIHSIGKRRTQSLRSSETRSSDNEQLSRSSHRHRRIRGSTSRESSQHHVKPDRSLDLEEAVYKVNGSVLGEHEKAISRHFRDSFYPSTEEHDYSAVTKQGDFAKVRTSVLMKGHVETRAKRVSGGRIDASAGGSHSSHGRRNKTSNSKRQERQNLEHSSTNPEPKICDSGNSNDARSQSNVDDQYLGSGIMNPATDQSLLAQSLGSESTSRSISRRTRPTHVQRQALFKRSSSLTNVHKSKCNSREIRNPSSLRLKRQSSEGKLSSIHETDECGSPPTDGDEVGGEDTESLRSQSTEATATALNKKTPSLTESLERGSKLNIRLFDEDGQETVCTDDGSLWLDQGSVSGLEIKSSASVVAPQLVFDHNMSRIVEQA